MECEAENNNEDFSDHIFISPLDIMDYFDTAKRPIRDGTELLNAGWVHAIGIVPSPANERVMGLVIQTSSSMTSSPHEIKLDNLKKKCNEWRCLCSCKAGSGEKCKHIAACLLHINRYPNLQAISSTDLRQKWGKTGRDITKQYSSVSTTEMCNIRKKIFMRDDHIPEEELDVALHTTY